MRLGQGNHWGLIVIPMFWPFMCPLHPYITQRFSAPNCASPTTIFGKIKNSYHMGSGVNAGNGLIVYLIGGFCPVAARFPG